MTRDRNAPTPLGNPPRRAPSTFRTAGTADPASHDLKRAFFGYFHAVLGLKPLAGAPGRAIAPPPGMRIEPHANLTITLLHRHLFGSDRLAGSVPRREVPIDGLIQADR